MLLKKRRQNLSNPFGVSLQVFINKVIKKIVGNKTLLAKTKFEKGTLGNIVGAAKQNFY